MESENEWSWEKRLQLDIETHRQQCKLCHSLAVKTEVSAGVQSKFTVSGDHTVVTFKIPPRQPGQYLYGVKHKGTREYQHVIATSIDEGLRELGWERGMCWVSILDARVKETMSEETKARLREIGRAKRGLRPKVVREPRIDPRHTHTCPECHKNYFHTEGGCDRVLERKCIMCETVFVEEPKEGVLTAPAPRVKMAPLINTNRETETQEGGDIMDLKGFVKEFIDDQVYGQDEKGKPELDESKLFNLAKANGLDCGKYRKDFKENQGRIRMTIGNMIRGAAVRNGKLITINGASKPVPSNLLPPKKEKAEKKDSKPASKKKAKAKAA